MRFDLASLGIGDKLALRALNPRYDKPHVETYMQAHPPKRAIYDAFMSGAVGDYDVWNRTGVMTLIERQFIVEHLTGKKFAPLPITSTDEEVWFKKLMADPVFRHTYDRIDWSSPEAYRAYTNALDPSLSTIDEDRHHGDMPPREMVAATP